MTFCLGMIVQEGIVGIADSRLTFKAVNTFAEQIRQVSREDKAALEESGLSGRADRSRFRECPADSVRMRRKI